MEKSRSENLRFLTYFRFPPSYTAVRAVRHTAVYFVLKACLIA